jgi:hypothetical protein
MVIQFLILMTYRFDYSHGLGPTTILILFKVATFKMFLMWHLLRYTPSPSKRHYHSIRVPCPGEGVERLLAGSIKLKLLTYGVWKKFDNAQLEKSRLALGATVAIRLRKIVS